MSTELTQATPTGTPVWCFLVLPRGAAVYSGKVTDGNTATRMAILLDEPDDMARLWDLPYEHVFSTKIEAQAGLIAALYQRRAIATTHLAAHHEEIGRLQSQIGDIEHQMRTDGLQARKASCDLQICESAVIRMWRETNRIASHRIRFTTSDEAQAYADSVGASILEGILTQILTIDDVSEQAQHLQRVLSESGIGDKIFGWLRELLLAVVELRTNNIISRPGYEHLLKLFSDSESGLQEIRREHHIRTKGAD